jgi:hypothetical protein
LGFIHTVLLASITQWAHEECMRKFKAGVKLGTDEFVNCNNQRCFAVETLDVVDDNRGKQAVG